MDSRYYEDYLEGIRKAASVKNRTAGLAKLIFGVLLLIGTIAQCMLPVIWLLPFGLCVVFGIMLIVLGGMALKSGNQ